MLKILLEQYTDVILIGESIRDPYGGACKVTRGLTRIDDERVLDTTISEAAIVGTATGLAMRGYYPIVEIMFSDFLTLCVDQVFNVASKIGNNHCPIRMIIRTLYNAGSDYGPTHSQDMRFLVRALLEKEPLIRLMEPTISSDIYAMYKAMLGMSKGIFVVFENKGSYPLPMEI